MSDIDIVTEDDNSQKFQPKSLILKISIFIIVLLVGAAIFQAIEKKDEKQNEKDYLEDIDFKIMLITKYNISSDDFGKLTAVVEGEIRHKDLAKKPRWTFSNSVFLAFSIMTTIGYGHLTPKTSGGQIFCIFFSLFAIPIAGIMLISVGSHVSLALQKFISFVEKRLLRREMGLNTELKSTVVTFVFMILIIISGAFLTSHTDGWTFVEGMYFTFISLSTIGFGDFVINNGELNDPDHKKSIAVNFTIVLITIGLCVVSSVLCSVSSVIEEKQKRMSAGRVAAPEFMALSAMNKITKEETQKNASESQPLQSLNNNSAQV